MNIIDVLKKEMNGSLTEITKMSENTKSRRENIREFKT